MATTSDVSNLPVNIETQVPSGMRLEFGWRVLRVT
jgi:hypothetical protein